MNGKDFYALARYRARLIGEDWPDWDSLRTAQQSAWAACAREETSATFDWTQQSPLTVPPSHRTIMGLQPPVPGFPTDPPTQERFW